MRERLRDTYREADAKTGKQRAELDISLCWAPWLTWILDDWEGQHLTVALNATSLGDRFVILVISIVYRGCAVPVAWKVLKVHLETGMAGVIKTVSKSFVRRLTVIVLADRGVYARLFYVVCCWVTGAKTIKIRG
jgi:hypothetical protein